MNFNNKVALVTGASRGIGRAIAIELAKNGCDVLINYRNSKKQAEELADLIEKKYNVKAKTCKADISKEEECKNLVCFCLNEFGKVDILVNCAGSAKNAGVLTMTDDEWDFTISTDQTSVFKMTRAFAKIMKENNYGRIINIASMYGLVGNTALSTVAYHSSKGGVVNFTRAVAAELATSGITCNAICPGYFETELTKPVLDTEDFQAYMKATVPMQRYGQEGELNAGAIFLASKEASYVTGVILPIDGGYTAV